MTRATGQECCALSLLSVPFLCCSESCLNAYKMNIFCKETEAHIQMMPQLQKLVSRSSKDPLITPDMWLRDRSPSSVAAAAAAAAAGEPTQAAAGEESGAPSAAERRRLRRARPEPPRPPAHRGVRARSHTMPVLELRERARRRPSGSGGISWLQIRAGGYHPPALCCLFGSAKMAATRCVPAIPSPRRSATASSATG